MEDKYNVVNNKPHIANTLRNNFLLFRKAFTSTFFINDENSNYPIWWGARWRFKKHAEMRFWRWICSWARAVKKPSDIGFSDEGYILPLLEIDQLMF